MKHIFVLIFVLVQGVNPIFSQTLKGKKLVAEITVLSQEGKTRQAIELIQSNIENAGKHQGEVLVILAELQINALLLDSANLSLMQAKKTKKFKQEAKADLLNSTITQRKEQYKIEVALGFKSLLDSDFENAATSFNNALKYDSGNYEVWLGKGESAHLLQQHEAAIGLYENGLTKYTATPQEKSHLYEHLAEEYLALRETVMTSKICDKALAIDPNNQEVIFLNGMARYYERDFVTAIGVFSNYLTNNPDREDVLYNRGLSYLELRQYNLAVLDFSRVLELDDNNVDALLGRGKAYYYFKQYENAKKDLTKVANTQKDVPYLLNALGVVEVSLGNLTEAANHFSKAHQKEVANYTYTYNLGKTYLMNNQFEEALVIFEELRKTKPNNPVYNVSLCYTLIGLEKYREAEALFNQSIEANPFVKEYFEVGAEISRKMGDKPMAKTRMEEYAKIHSEGMSFQVLF
tara:strand:+ start:90449 stop:91837 length:1389 start_codon:yes stop_codon:yes gene_type:complete